MKQVILILTVAIFGFSTVQAQKKTKKEESKNKTEEIKTKNMENEKDSVSYGLGLLIAKNLKGQGLDSLNYEKFVEGMKATMDGTKPIISEQEANVFINNYLQACANEKAAVSIAAGKKYLEENGKRKGVTTTASGLQYEVLKQGSGAKPKDLNTNVTAHYHGTLPDGTVFDSSVDRNQPFVTNVGQVIKAWQEALLMMEVGTKLRIVCPPNIAYGERGAGGAIGPNAVLVFEMELISINN
jgi:FKBP-type peptidyl-prolyl cis-trans isomerase FklB